MKAATDAVHQSIPEEAPLLTVVALPPVVNLSQGYHAIGFREIQEHPQDKVYDRFVL